jgi:hypothetical protein
VLLPLAAAVGGVLLASTPAFATVKATWTKPTDSAVFTTSAPVDFTVTLDRGTSGVLSSADGTAVTMSLTVPGPQAGPYKVDTSSGTTDKDLKFTLTPGCANYAAPCGDGGAPAYNGYYTATLSGGASGTRTVSVQVPPAAPTGVTATATGQHRVKVAWAANAEPDTTGYDVFTADGQTVAANLPASQLSFEFDLPDTGYGGDHSYVVRAHRLACGNCNGSTAQLDSPLSSAATVTLDEPTPAPDSGNDGGGYNGGTSGGSSTGGNSGGTGGGYNGGGSGNGSGGGGNGGSSTGGSGTGGSTDNGGYNSGASTGGSFSSGAKVDPAVAAARQRLAFGLTFKSFAPKLGAPKLPPLPKFAAPTVEIPEGTYDPMLSYGDRTITTTEKVAGGSNGVTGQIVDSVVSVFQGARLFRSIAIALLCLLAAAHVRVWLGHTPPTA